MSRLHSDGAAARRDAVRSPTNAPAPPGLLRQALLLVAKDVRIELRAKRRERSVKILIDDDGPGIPSGSREDVFKPFFRLDASRNPTTGGVGLGLTIARDVVRAHGGDIWLEDSPLGGLRARIKLPV